VLTSATATFRGARRAPPRDQTRPHWCKTITHNMKSNFSIE
jgi:hypothetical protein